MSDQAQGESRESREGGLRIASEFASVQVRQVRTGNGSRLEVSSERSDSTVLLDALTLDLLSRLDPRGISQLVNQIIEGAE